jgi:hypothetical protein
MLLGGCGGGGGDTEANKAAIQAVVMGMAKSHVNDDKKYFATVIRVDAGVFDPIAAQDLDTKAGRQRLRDGDRRFVRKCMRDAGIDTAAQLGAFEQSLEVRAGSSSGTVSFEFQKEDSKYVEKCILKFRSTETGWQVESHDRVMVNNK